jgi:hypothetical protein
MKDPPREYLRHIARKRWAGKSQEERSAAAQAASLSFWQKLSPEERSEEMRRRAKVRAANGAKKAKGREG